MYDLIIIGAGPAGITASVYAARKKMDFLVITEDIGGQAAWSGDVENYTGYQFVTGPELTAKFEEHMKTYGVKLRESEKVESLRKNEGKFLIKTNKGEYESKSVIVASGKKSRELGIPGEKEYKNKGVTYCATCDGPIFSGKDVVVIGGGNSGLDAAMQLINIANHVYIIEAGEKLMGEEIVQEKIRKSEKVTILTNTKILEIKGEKMVKSVKVKSGDKEKILDVEGIFVEIGLVPNSGFAGELSKNKQGEIKVNSYNETNIPGIFAAGDVSDVPEKQIIIAAGEGAKAVLSAFSYLTRQK